jgi:hypothetical protein
MHNHILLNKKTLLKTHNTYGGSVPLLLHFKKHQMLNSRMNGMRNTNTAVGITNLTTGGSGVRLIKAGSLGSEVKHLEHMGERLRNINFLNKREKQGSKIKMDF